METKTRSELLALCKERKIKGCHKMKKTDMVDLLCAASPQTPTEPQVDAVALLQATAKQDTGLRRTNPKEQFYTKESVALSCIQRVLSRFPETHDYVWVEPSAGKGSFFHQFPSDVEKIGLDMEPCGKHIVAQDYLTWTLPSFKGKSVIVCGNPPFGRQSSLAKAFILKSCSYANLIAFILPKSFTKPSMFHAFHRTFHLVESVELTPHAFLIQNEPYDVPCVFQIWQKQATERLLEPKTVASGFQYVKSEEVYHIVCRRVGGSAGTCHVCDGTVYNPQSHYFLALDHDVVPFLTDLIIKMNAHTFPSNTVGPRSLSKSEINLVMNAIIASFKHD